MRAGHRVPAGAGVGAAVPAWDRSAREAPRRTSRERGTLDKSRSGASYCEDVNVMAVTWRWWLAD